MTDERIRRARPEDIPAWWSSCTRSRSTSVRRGVSPHRRPTADRLLATTGSLLPRGRTRGEVRRPARSGSSASPPGAACTAYLETFVRPETRGTGLGTPLTALARNASATTTNASNGQSSTGHPRHRLLQSPWAPNPRRMVPSTASRHALTKLGFLSLGPRFLARTWLGRLGGGGCPGRLSRGDGDGADAGVNLTAMFGRGG